MTPQQKAIDLIQNPVKIAHAVGFTKMTELHNGWIKKFIRGKDDLTLQSHRGSYKTSSLEISLSLIMMSRRHENTMFLRKTDTDVAEVITTVARILQEDVVQEIYYALTGEHLLITRQTESMLSTSAYGGVSGAPQLQGIGIGGSLTGKHADLVITDDIINVKDRVSRAERERTKLTYQELQNVRNPGGRIINTGTPWHKDDAFSIMPQAEKYDVYSTGILSAEGIEFRKSTMTRSLFAANYELRHVASDDVIFSNPQTGADINKIRQGVSHVDAAFNGEDYTAFTIIRRIDGKYYVFGKIWRAHVDKVMDQIVGWHNEYQCGKMWNEDNADKGLVAKELRRKGIRVVSYSEHQNKFIKISSVLKFCWDDVIFCEGTDKAYIEQITDYNENAEHDDAPDSLASLIREAGKHADGGVKELPSFY